MRCGDRMRREEMEPRRADADEARGGVGPGVVELTNGVSRAPHGVTAGLVVSLLANSDRGGGAGTVRVASRPCD
jgi:hypothetical protein